MPILLNDVKEFTGDSEPCGPALPPAGSAAVPGPPSRETASGEEAGAGGRARGRRGGGCTLAERSGSRVCLLQIGAEEGGSEGKALEIIYMQKKTAGRKEEIEHTGTGG